MSLIPAPLQTDVPFSSVGFKPIWPLLSPDAKDGFTEEWRLRVNDPKSDRAFWIRFVLLTSKNGFRRVGEIWALHTTRKENREIQKIAMKQSQSIDGFRGGTDSIQMGDQILTGSRCQGTILSKGKALKWNLEYKPRAQLQSCSMVPEGLIRAGLIKAMDTTLCPDLEVQGTVELDGEVWVIESGRGVLTHQASVSLNHCWVRAQCSQFSDEQGNPSDLVVEGLGFRAPLFTGLPRIKHSTFYFRYQGMEYMFNSLWDSVRARSKVGLTEWEFKVDRGPISFRGSIKSELRDFVGLTLEDTDASLLHASRSDLADATVLVYRKSKLEARLSCVSRAALEVVSEEKNPYVPTLL